MAEGWTAEQPGGVTAGAGEGEESAGVAAGAGESVAPAGLTDGRPDLAAGAPDTQAPARSEDTASTANHRALLIVVSSNGVGSD